MPIMADLGEKVMSNGNRFGFGVKRIAQSNYVTTREYGDIPGILKAQDVFVSIPIETMKQETFKRAGIFCQKLKQVIDGADERGTKYGYKDFQNEKIHSTDLELSAIQNPCKPYNKAL